MISHCLGVPALARRYESAVDLTATLERDPSRLVADHLDYEVFGEIFAPAYWPRLRLLLLIRHPLDALISNFYKRYADDLLPDRSQSIKLNLQRFLRGEFDRMAIREVVRRTPLFATTYAEYLRRFALGWYRTRGVRIIRYEDLVVNTRDELSQIMKFLGTKVTTDKIEEAVTLYSFECLSGGRSAGESDVMSHYRNGVPGEWLAFLEDRDIEAAHERVGDIVSALGYSLRRA